MKRIIELILANIPHPSVWFRRGPTLSILTYHRILPTGDPCRKTEQPGMIAAPETLERNIGWLKSKGYEFISLEDWPKVTEKAKSKSPKYAAITFDDGWLDNLLHAATIINETKVPATIYLVGNHLQNGKGFWPTDMMILASYLTEDSLMEMLATDSLLEFEASSQIKRREMCTELRGHQIGQVNRYIEQCKKYPDQQLEEIINRLFHRLNIPDEVRSKTVTPAQVNELIENGFSIGSHTLNHRRLTTGLSESDIANEVIDSKKTLEHICATSVTSFCYPNGDWDPVSRNFATQAYQTAVTTELGKNWRESDNHTLKRLTMHDGVSANKNRFFARLNGWI